MLTIAATVGLVACARQPVEDIGLSLARVKGTACLRPILATAVVVDEGRMLTTAHAVAGADEDLRVVALDKSEFGATVIGFDSDLDLALLKVDGLDAAIVPKSQPEVGDTGTILAISAALEVRRIGYLIEQVVSARSGDIYDEGEVLRKALDLEAMVEPGDSGAPLLDMSGSMVGMLFARSSEQEDGAWALHIDEIETFLEATVDGIEVDHGHCR